MNQSNTALAVQGTLNARAGNFTSTVTIGKGSTAGTLTVGTNGSNTITIAGTNSASTTKVAASNGAFELLADGNASFADGNITFAADGDITSRTFLIERTRLFGSGSDGNILHYANAVTAPSLTSNTGFLKDHGLIQEVKSYLHEQVLVIGEWTMIFMLKITTFLQVIHQP